LQKLIIAAMKQSLKAYLPLLHEPASLEKVIRTPFTGQKFIGYCDAQEPAFLQKAYVPGSDALILIGPEGDFSHEEFEMAKNAGFIPITLGNSRLRTETAGVVGCTIINFLNQ
jgi:16S rRNA (uracil1498-N3)-methyltransferase